MGKDRVRQFVEGTKAASTLVGSFFMVALTLVLIITTGVVILDTDIAALKPAPGTVLSVDTDTDANNLTIEHKRGEALDSAHTRIVVDGNGSETTFEPTSVSTTLTAGEQATIDLDDVNGNNRIDWTTDRSGWEYNQSGGFDGFEGGEEITVRIYDTESQKVVFRTTVTAEDATTSANAVSQVDGSAAATNTKKLTFDVSASETVTVEQFAITTANNLSTLSSVTGNDEVKITGNGPSGRADAPSGYPTDGTTYTLNTTKTIDSGTTATVKIKKFGEKITIYGFTDAGSADITVTLMFADGSQTTFHFAADSA